MLIKYVVELIKKCLALICASFVGCVVYVIVYACGYVMERFKRGENDE